MSSKENHRKQVLSLAQIRAKIRRLHARGQPLNISAVRRSHPELLEAAFVQRPFLGWRGALRAAGIEYSQIHVSLSRVVECQLCGQQMGSLFSHLRNFHGWSREDYQWKFPSAELVNGRTFGCGVLQTPSLGELRDHVPPGRHVHVSRSLSLFRQRFAFRSLQSAANLKLG